MNKMECPWRCQDKIQQQQAVWPAPARPPPCPLRSLTSS